MNKTVFDITVDFEKSHGSFLIDYSSGKEYLDFLNMFSSLPIGYNHDIFDKSFEAKIVKVSKIRMANNLFNTSELIDYRLHLQKYMKHPYIHFTSTGALAIESAQKAALFQNKHEDPIFWALEKAFHGINSWGFLTDIFGPTAERVSWYPKNNWKNLSIDSMIDKLESNSYPESLIGIVIEPILCTSGDIYLSPEKLKYLRRLCLKRDICFIVDEIQTGFGSTGAMWYSDSIDLDYDILVFGKKSQIMGINVNEKYSAAFKSPLRILEVTFDGDLVDAIRSDYILKAYERDNLIDLAKRRENDVVKFFSAIFPSFRASGNLWAFDFNSSKERDRFCDRCFSNNLLVNKGGEKSIRMRPNLAVTDDELSLMKNIIMKVA
jgi:L-lysine 6-transaminase